MRQKASVLVILWACLGLCTCFVLPQPVQAACCTESSSNASYEPAGAMPCEDSHACCLSVPPTALQVVTEGQTTYAGPASLPRTDLAPWHPKTEQALSQTALAHAYVPNQSKRYLDLRVLLN